MDTLATFPQSNQVRAVPPAVASGERVESRVGEAPRFEPRASNIGVECAQRLDGVQVMTFIDRRTGLVISQTPARQVLAVVDAPPVVYEEPRVPIERPLSEVIPPGRGRPAVTVPASHSAIEASPVLVEVSPALVAAPPIGEESPVVPENLLSERRVVEKPLPRVDVPVPAPSPAAVVRTEASLPADAPAPPPGAPPAVPGQIVSAVVSLHGRGDGRHEVTLELRPDDLGTIRVEVSVEQQTVHLTLHAAEPATGRLLSGALAELRGALADAGLRAGHLAVSSDGGRATGRRSRPEPPAAEKARDDPTTPEKVRAVRPSAAGRLDLLL